MNSQHMKVGLLAVDCSPHHGWGQYCINLARSLARTGVQIRLVAAENSPDLPGISLRRGLPNLVPRERGLPLRLWFARHWVQKTLRDCQVIHSLVEPYAPLAAWCAGERPYFITGHGSYVNASLKPSGLRGRLYRQAFSGSVGVICISQFTETQLRKWLPNAASTVIGNGVNVDRFAHLPQASNRKRIPTVLAVGAVKPRKGILPLVEAIALARESIPDLRCVVVGETSSNPAYVAQVRSCIETHALGDAVQLLGTVDEATLLAHYAAATVFCLPTLQYQDDFEGYGQVYLEAGLAGLPVIATDAGGVSDVVQDGETGILLPAADLSQRLPVAIVQLIQDETRASALAAAGRARASSLSWDHVAQQYLQLYERGLTHATRSGQS
ncbi:MAG: glycosyltransferase family 4 protein [Chloroflexi bacterium]|nr:glycosyltransferase family 4 protein [Chloroflexota bacterium]